MHFKTIELQIRQLEESFSKSRSNIYSDKRKNIHFREIYALFEKIKSSNYTEFEPSDLETHNFFLKIIFKGLEYLNDSILNVIPYEIINCLEYALEDWIDDHNFIIVTSLSNTMNDFYLESTLNKELYNVFNFLSEKAYGLKLTHRLIQISLPKVLSRDYLSCVVLYHELGHFIDNQLNISAKLLHKKFNISKPDPNKPETEIFDNHNKEYFADLFASQYVNDSSNIYLNHISSGDSDSFTHPATSKRIQVVNDFLNGEQNSIVNEFNDVLKKSELPLLKKRYTEIGINDCTFKDLYPQKFNSKDELHYIFKLGWEIWNNSSDNFLKDFTGRQRYNIVNNLIEKSISNYVVQENWNKNR